MNTRTRTYLALAGGISAGLAVTPAYAADAVSAAQNFTNMATTVGSIVAVGFFIGGLIVVGAASLFSMPKMASGGKGAMVFAVVLGLATQALGFLTNTAKGIIG